MASFSVHYKPEEMEELCEKSPYNLKRDVKNLSNDELKRIAEEVANVLYYGVHRPPLISMLHWDKSRKVGCAKIRVVDVLNDSGKSNGYRCVALVDNINYHAFILHIYKHGSPREDNIDRSSQNKLDALVDEYASSLKANN